MQPDLDALNSETAAGADEQTAAARVRDLLDKGPLAEADEACKRALAGFPDFDILRALQADILQKETAIRHLLEKGEERLLEQVQVRLRRLHPYRKANGAAPLPPRTSS